MTLGSDLGLAVNGGAEGYPDLDRVRSWCRSLNLGVLVPGRSLAPPSATALRESLQGIRFPALRNVFAPVVQDDVRAALFTSSRSDAVESAVDATTATATLARAIGARFVIVELGPLRRRAPTVSAFSGGSELTPNDAEPWSLELYQQQAETQHNVVLDQVCRKLYEVSRREPEVRLAIATPAALPDLPTPDMLEALLEDLDGRRVGYWHDTGRARSLARQGVFDEEVWLDRFGAHCVGVDLTDCMDTMADLPAGSGEVDFVAVKSALGQDVIPVLRADPFPGPAPLLAALDFLRTRGF